MPVRPSALRNAPAPAPAPIQARGPAPQDWTVAATVAVYGLTTAAFLAQNRVGPSQFVPWAWKLLLVAQLTATAGNQAVAAKRGSFAGRLAWMAAFGPLYVLGFLANLYLLSFWAHALSQGAVGLTVWLILATLPATVPFWAPLRRWSWAKRLRALTASLVATALLLLCGARPHVPARLLGGVGQYVDLLLNR